MKSYEEMASSLLQRRDAYYNKRKKRMKYSLTVAGSCCLILLVCFGLWYGFKPDAEISKTANIELNINEKDTANLTVTDANMDLAKVDADIETVKLDDIVAVSYTHLNTPSSYYYMSLSGSKADKLALGKELQSDKYYLECEDYYTTFNITLAMYGSFLFLGILFCIIFIFSIFLILYYRMQEDLYENKRQFSILYRMGLTKREIAREFSREQRIIILMPPILAVVHCLFAYPS